MQLSVCRKSMCMCMCAWHVPSGGATTSLCAQLLLLLPLALLLLRSCFCPPQVDPFAPENRVTYSDGWLDKIFMKLFTQKIADQLEPGQQRCLLRWVSQQRTATDSSRQQQQQPQQVQQS
jgi:hypothetical protein